MTNSTRRIKYTQTCTDIEIEISRNKEVLPYVNNKCGSDEFLRASG